MGDQVSHTALDVAKLNAADELAGMIEENRDHAPEMALIPGFTIPGTTFKTVIREEVPEGGFKDAGGGVVIGKNRYRNDIVETFPYENHLGDTLDIARGYRRGEAAWLTLQESGAVKGAMQKFGRQLYYGRNGTGDSKGHPGLVDSYNKDKMTVDAGGTTANTCSSVWFLSFGDMEDGKVSYVFGNETVMEFGEWMKQRVEISTGKFAMSWVNALLAHVGVQFLDIHAVGRIKKLTEDAGKGLTDKLGHAMLEKFPVGMTPDIALMTKRSRRQLQDSRTNTQQPGAVALPTDIAGIPIAVTDSILNTEALTL